MKKKIDQARFNKISTIVVTLLALYSAVLTWWVFSAHMDTKQSLEFLYTNVEFRNPSR